MKFEIWAEASLPKHGLTLPVVDDWHFDLFEDLLVSSLSEGVLAPAGSHATLAGEFNEAVGQADWADVRVAGVVHVPVHADDGDVVELKNQILNLIFEKTKLI